MVGCFGAFCLWRCGCHVALDFGAPFVIAVFMGMVTATGGGVIRDVLTNTQPMILCGQVYATAALFGSLSYASLRSVGLTEIPAKPYHAEPLSPCERQPSFSTFAPDLRGVHPIWTAGFSIKHKAQ